MTQSRAPRPPSLRNQLFTLVAALAIPLLLLQAWWSWYDYRSAREHAETNALAVADATVLGVTQFFTQAEELMTATTNRFGREWMAEESCREGITDLTNILPFLRNAIAVNRDGSILCSAHEPPEGATARNWNWWDSVNNDPVFTVGRPAMGDITEDWILPLVSPVLDEEGRFDGAIVGTVRLAELSRLVGALTIPADHLVTVATADRTVIARSMDAEERVGTSLPPLTGSDREVAPGRWVATGPDLAGIQRTWGQVAVEPDWIVYVGVPNTVVFGPARLEALTHMGTTLLVVILGMLLAGRSYRRIARALRELATRTRGTAAGHTVPLPADTPTEVREVVTQFNHTLAARDRAQAAERSARQRFESLFENAMVGLYVSTADGRFLQVNEQLVDLLGYDSADDLIAAGPRSLYVDPAVRERLVATTLATGASPTQEVEWLRADGVPITVRIGGKIIPGPGSEPVFEMIVQDVTEEKRTEAELRQTQKMEAIGQLAGGVAHDFNNLLTVISGNVELLEEELEPSDPVREDLAQIAKATARAAALTRRLLTFSRKQPQGLRPVDVKTALTELAGMLVPLLGERVSLELDLAPDRSTIIIDPGEFEQIVLNLVLNARDAMKGEGTVRIGVRNAPGPDNVGEDPVDGLLLTVEDDGMGMDQATTQRIFEPFYTTKPMGEGTGLGLSTVYGIVRRLGGSVHVRSQPGKGTEMLLWFPRAGDESAGIETPEPTEPSAEGSEAILVVEDDGMVRRLVERSLRDAGYEVVGAASVRKAMERVHERNEPFDLVISDVVMPEAGGAELAARLKAESSSVPILFMSGYLDEPLLEAQLEGRPGQLLRKPFTPAQLRHRVRAILHRTESMTPGD